MLGIARVWSGIPYLKDLGKLSSLSVNQAGSLLVHLTQGLERTTDSITSWAKMPTGVASGTTQVSNAAATALNGGTSLECVLLLLQNRVGNSPIAFGDSGIAGVNEGLILQAGAWDLIRIDNVSKLYGYATVLNENVDWLAFTR